jgi:hypothetical protein
MALLEINHNPSRRELRQFAGIWFPAAFAVIGGWVYYKFGWTPALAIWVPALLVSIVGFFKTSWMRLIFVGWMYAAFPIGWTVSHLLLGGIYYLILTPTGLLMRLVGRDPMRRKFEPAAATYWLPREEVTDKTRYFRQF